MKKLLIGDVTIISIIERDGPWRTPQEMFPAYERRRTERKYAPAAFLRARRRPADSRLRFDPGAGRRSGLERTGERMLGAAERQADEKTWPVVCTRQVLIHHEYHELVYHRVPRRQVRTDQVATLLYATRVAAQTVAVELFPPFHHIAATAVFRSACALDSVPCARTSCIRRATIELCLRCRQR